MRAPPAVDAVALTLEQFLESYRTNAPALPEEGCGSFEMLRFLHRKLFQLVMLALRARQERLILSRSLLADVVHAGANRR